MERKILLFLFSVAIFILVILLFFLPLYLGDALRPETMIGEAGLKAVRKYCGMLLLVHVGAAILVPLTIESIARYHRKRNGKPFLSAFWRIPITVILTGAYLIFYPKVTHVELQTEGGTQSTFALVRAASLWMDAGKDLRNQTTVSLGTVPVDVKQVRYEYTYTTGSSRYSFSTRKGYENEMGIFAKNGELIAQIGYAEAGKVKRSAFPYQQHSIELYEHSKMLASVDGLHQFTGTGKWEDMITLTYDYDAGVIRRELFNDNEKETVPEMRLHLEIETATEKMQSGGNTIVNGQTKLQFKPLIPGIGRAWIEMQVANATWERVSNIIETSSFVDAP